MTNTDDIHEIIGEMLALQETLKWAHGSVEGIRDTLISQTATGTPSKGTLEHLEYLETEGDYKNAPGGTIVAADGGEAYTRRGGWIRGDEVYGSRYMAAMPRRVLRWGWGSMSPLTDAEEAA